MIVCRHYVVSGLVQGVFFRGSTQEVAERLGITGWVRNLRDRRVELIACGEETQLGELERWLWKGPAQSRVENVEASDAPLETFASFDVRY